MSMLDQIMDSIIYGKKSLLVLIVCHFYHFGPYRFNLDGVS